jgi:hypothetical protein
VKCPTLFSHVSVYLIRKDDMHFNHCTRKNIDRFAALLVLPEPEGEMEEKSNDGIERGVPERGEEDDRRAPTE